ncbi:hypothetical protein CXG81DRAFT_18414 [Caulochytrium protostelioides]|uniref:Uncharacterized protein n=1 Tax=Caulochytrium protostelioides TaxID=1555241 RepID=A0A4P9X9T9_9FUNG|nr:hypothetical protein CXG81DRAFT_18414 [Caulochytrium protostelioides]|eukprot:RKP01850.1 hypothetical protein CXG81DRAFT_18414 [Caulochytrium protostelioides]
MARAGQGSPARCLAALAVLLAMLTRTILAEGITLKLRSDYDGYYRFSGPLERHPAQSWNRPSLYSWSASEEDALSRDVLKSLERMDQADLDEWKDRLLQYSLHPQRNGHEELLKRLVWQSRREGDGVKKRVALHSPALIVDPPLIALSSLPTLSHFLHTLRVPFSQPALGTSHGRYDPVTGCPTDMWEYRVMAVSSDSAYPRWRPVVGTEIEETPSRQIFRIPEKALPVGEGLKNDANLLERLQVLGHRIVAGQTTCYPVELIVPGGFIVKTSVHPDYFDHVDAQYKKLRLNMQRSRGAYTPEQFELNWQRLKTYEEKRLRFKALVPFLTTTMGAQLSLQSDHWGSLWASASPTALYYASAYPMLGPLVYENPMLGAFKQSLTPESYALMAIRGWKIAKWIHERYRICEVPELWVFQKSDDDAYRIGMFKPVTWCDSETSLRDAEMRAQTLYGEALTEFLTSMSAGADPERIAPIEAALQGVLRSMRNASDARPEYQFRKTWGDTDLHNGLSSPPQSRERQAVSRNASPGLSPIPETSVPDRGPSPVLI